MIARSAHDLHDLASVTVSDLELIGRTPGAWMIDDSAHEHEPSCDGCGHVATVRFRCREHFVVLCRRCLGDEASADRCSCS